MYRLLIADDEAIEKAVLYQTLKRYFGDICEIYQAENGRTALEQFREHDIQIVVLDIEMPGINGIEAAEIMRQEKPGCCIVFLTAFDEFSYARKAIGIRAMDYLLKPCDEKELIGVVEEAIRVTDSHNREYAPEEHRGSGEEHEGKNWDIREKMERFIRENFGRDISMQDAARAMNYSDAYFCKLFKQYFSKNFTTYLTEFRMEEAKRLLSEPTVNIKEIGERVGYPDSNYFAKVFKRTTGVSPSEFRGGQHGR